MQSRCGNHYGRRSFGAIRLAGIGIVLAVGLSQSLGAGNAKTYGAVGLLTMHRDGFGSVSPMNRSAPAQLVTCAIPTRDIGRLAVNAEGLSPEASLRVELLDELERPLPAYAGESAAVVHEGGVQKPIHWPRGGVPLLHRPIRIRIRFEGARRDQARLYAIYLDLKEPSA